MTIVSSTLRNVVTLGFTVLIERLALLLGRPAGAGRGVQAARAASRPA